MGLQVEYLQALMGAHLMFLTYEDKTSYWVAWDWANRCWNLGIRDELVLMYKSGAISYQEVEYIG